MTYYLVQPDGSKVQALGMQDLQNAILNGTQIVDSSGFIYDNGINPGSLISVAGGYLLGGCPLNVLFGAPLSLVQAQVLVQNAPSLTKYPTCLNQARTMVASAAPASTTGSPTGVGVSNSPEPLLIPSSTTTQQPSVSSSVVAAAIAPSVPNALPIGTGSNVGGDVLTTLYRFILQVPGGYATGANRQGCSQTNSAMCDPQFFNTLQDAINYALSNGEVPYQVLTSNDAWNLMSGTLAINPAQIYNSDGSLGSSGPFGIPWWMLIAAGVGTYLLTR